jgi:hypothetical protein
MLGGSTGVVTVRLAVGEAEAVPIMPAEASCVHSMLGEGDGLTAPSAEGLGDLRDPLKVPPTNGFSGLGEGLGASLGEATASVVGLGWACTGGADASFGNGGGVVTRVKSSVSKATTTHAATAAQTGTLGVTSPERVGATSSGGGPADCSAMAERESSACQIIR